MKRKMYCAYFSVVLPGVDERILEAKKRSAGLIGYGKASASVLYLAFDNLALLKDFFNENYAFFDTLDLKVIPQPIIADFFLPIH